MAVIAEGLAGYFDENDPILKGAPRDEHGHIRLAEIPLGKVLRTAVGDSLANRGVNLAIGEKDVGYELRCGYPNAFDRDYTRDLGVGAVQSLLAGHTSALITRQSGRIVPVPFIDIVDTETGRARVRQVDTSTDSYRNALALQERITAQDLEDPEILNKIAVAANLSPEETRVRYAPIS